MQTTLMKVYVAWPRIRRDGSVDAYARRVMVNAHVDETRRPWRRERVGVDGLDLAGRAAATSPEDRDLLMAALADLPPRQRAAVVLRHS